MIGTGRPSPVTITYTDEAVKRIRERAISQAEVEVALTAGEPVREYGDDRPYPSRLVLALVDGRPLHVVYAVNAVDDEVIVITTYRSDPAVWEPDFKQRRQR